MLLQNATDFKEAPDALHSQGRLVVVNSPAEIDPLELKHWPIGGVMGVR